MRLFHQCIGHSAECQDSQDGAGDVQAWRCRRVPRFRDVSQRQHDHDRRDGNVDEKHPTPRDLLHKESAEERPDGGRDATQTGPCADCPGTICRDEGRLNNARPPGVSRAPPMPWSVRAATRVPMPGATPHSSEATANHATPMRNTLRRPKRSAREPPSRMKAARVSVYAVTVHCSPENPVFRDSPMAGSGVFHG